MKFLPILSVPLLTTLLAQNYQCDWSVVATGGGKISTNNYSCGATVGQNATGIITSSNLQALIGFWQSDGEVAIKEKQILSHSEKLFTQLLPPYPNPCRKGVIIRYTLANKERVLLQVHDVTGRVVNTLVNSTQNPDNYHLRWNGKDTRGALLPNGVYFCRFNAGDYRSTEKIIFSR